MTPPLLDTSFLIRYLMSDPPDQATAAARVIDGGAPVSLTGTGLAETAHVLRSVYRVPREAIIDALVGVVTKATVQLIGVDRGTAVEALLLCRPPGRVSVPDALTWAEARTSGANAVYSFDRSFPSGGVAIHRR